MNRYRYKITLVTILFLFCICLPLFAAEEPVSFEQKHSDKNCIFLSYDMTLELKEDWSYVTTTHKKVKILNEDAKKMGEIPVPYEKNRESVKVNYANTITPDSKKHRYSKIQDLKLYNDYPMYSDAMVKVITMPEVNIGSIIEVETVVATKKSPIKDAFWDSIDFDFTIPAQQVTTIIVIPKKLGIAYKEFNLSYKPKITENAKTITYSWSLQNVDPIERSEGYLPPPTPGSFKNIIELSSIKSWADVSKWYYSLVQKNLKPTRAIEDKAKELTKDLNNTKDKVRAILEYVQDNFRYVSMSFDENSLEPHPTDEVFRNKYGDCKDLSLLCMAMLKAIGINTNITLFNTEYSICDPKYDLPFPTLFDHVILRVENKDGGGFYVDPVLKGYDIGEFPLSYQGGYCFIIDDKEGKFDKFPIFDEKRNSTATKRFISLNGDGSAIFESEHTWELGSSVDMRHTLKNMDKETEKKFYQALEAYLTSGGEMIERRVEGLDNKYGLIKGCTKYRRKDAFPLDGNMMIIDVAGYDRDVDFTLKERKNPIFFPVNSLVEETTTYKIPQGFIVSHIPKNINLKMGYFEMTRDYKRKDDLITVTETTRLKRSEYPKEDYQKFKDFFDKLPGKTRQRIVLKKVRPWQRQIMDFIAKFKKK